MALVNTCGSEFDILLTASLDAIAKNSTPKIAEGIDRVRRGDIVVEPGFDGKFGIVKIWPQEGEEGQEAQAGKEGIGEAQLNLFAQSQ